jgi:hypothetical protein
MTGSVLKLTNIKIAPIPQLEEEEHYIVMRFVTSVDVSFLGCHIVSLANNSWYFKDRASVFRVKLHDPANGAMILPSTRKYSSSNAVAHSIRPGSSAKL